jgi:hypothetical protein
VQLFIVALRKHSDKLPKKLFKFEILNTFPADYADEIANLSAFICGEIKAIEAFLNSF